MKCAIPVLAVVLSFGLSISQASAAIIHYSEGFESGGAAGFTFSSSNSSQFWHVTRNAPFAGTYALGYVHDETAGTVPNGSYAATAVGAGGPNGLALSPWINLPASDEIWYSFAARVDDEPGTADGDLLKVGITTGSTFGTTVASSELGSGGVHIPENAGYSSFLIDITQFAGQSIKLSFSFAADTTENNYPGPRIDNLSVYTPEEVAVVPEPSSLTIFGFGALCLLGYLRRRTKQGLAVGVGC